MSYVRRTWLRFRYAELLYKCGSYGIERWVTVIYLKMIFSTAMLTKLNSTAVLVFKNVRHYRSPHDFLFKLQRLTRGYGFIP